VAFTADPVTGDRDAVVVEALRGLGERLVSGTVSPDEWVVRDASATRRSSVEEAIDSGIANSVAVLARRVEQDLGGPQDIEWAYAGGEVLLLQARPITGVASRWVQPVPVPVEPPPGYWTREASHAPLPSTPFNRAARRSRAPGLRRMCEQLGLLFETIDFREIGGWEYTRIVPLGGKDRPAPPAPLLFRLVPPLRRRIKACVAAMRADVAGRLVRRWYQEWQPEFAARIAELRQIEQSTLTDAEVDEQLTSVLELTDHGVKRAHGAARRGRDNAR
jgi:rifampicin phosphotransferase